MASTSSRGWELAPRLWIMGTPTLHDIESRHISAIVRVARRPLDPAVCRHVRPICQEPLPDGQSVDVRATMRAARHTTTLWRQGETVLVTCVAGRNRSALVAALALVQLELVPPALVVEHIRARRPRALANPHALAWLERWLALAAERSAASTL